MLKKNTVNTNTNANAQPKVYAYLRVSSGRQSVNSQKIGVDQLAKQKGFKIHSYVNETGVSGKVAVNNRKLGKLLKKMKAGDILICSELSRLSRTMLSLMNVLQECLNKGIKIYTVKEAYCLGDNIEAKILAFAFSLVAEIERELIRDRTIEGLARARANGVKLGRRPGSKMEVHKIDKFENRIRKYIANGISQLQICKRIKVSPKTLRNFIREKHIQVIKFLKPNNALDTGNNVC